MGWLIGAIVVFCCIGVPLILLWRKRRHSSTAIPPEKNPPEEASQ